MRFAKLLILITVFCLFGITGCVSAYDMSSDNYKLQIEGIGIGAVGDMKDFSDSGQGQNPISILKEVFASHFSWKMTLIFFVALSAAVLIFWLIAKKFSLPKNEKKLSR